MRVPRLGHSDAARRQVAFELAKPDIGLPQSLLGQREALMGVLAIGRDIADSMQDDAHIRRSDVIIGAGSLAAASMKSCGLSLLIALRPRE
jgi:hypothetical protein